MSHSALRFGVFFFSFFYANLWEGKRDQRDRWGGRKKKNLPILENFTSWGLLEVMGEEEGETGGMTDSNREEWNGGADIGLDRYQRNVPHPLAKRWLTKSVLLTQPNSIGYTKGDGERTMTRWQIRNSAHYLSNWSSKYCEAISRGDVQLLKTCNYKGGSPFGQLAFSSVFPKLVKMGWRAWGKMYSSTVKTNCAATHCISC